MKGEYQSGSLSLVDAVSILVFSLVAIALIFFAELLFLWANPPPEADHEHMHN